MLESLVGAEAARRLEAFAALRWLTSRSHQFMERSVDQYDLSEGRMQVLMRLRHQGDCPLGALAEVMHVSARNVTGLVDHLERDGLVARVPDPEDRRSVRAHLTEQGQRLIERVWKDVSQQSLVLMEDLPLEDLELVRHTCLRLIERMESRLNQEGVATASQRSNQE
jgi:DNA-binding MarR family transcriptional regulator